MKRSLVIITLILLSFGIKAMAGGKTTSYVKTGSHVYFGQDVIIGLFNSKIIASDGTVTKIPKRDVVAYMHDSKLFEYLPVVDETNGTVRYAMMEYMTTRSGLNLYRHRSYADKNPKFEYYIFKGGKFHLRIDQKNAKTALPFFGIRVV